jgi:NADPH:quinone reductase-like Zn-dependent oxidoreductase
LSDTVLVTGKHTWSDSITVPANSVVKISSSLPAEEAANLPAAVSAWALLNNFSGSAALKVGDVVVQSNGESAIGLAVSQLGQHMGLKVVSLGAGGADADAKIKEAGGPVKLAIASNSGKPALSLLRALAVDGTLVVYNGVVESLDVAAGVTVPVASAIFQNSSVRGFDYCVWATADPAGYKKAVAAVVELADSKKITLRSKVFPQADFMQAISLVASTGGPAVLKH